MTDSTKSFQIEVCADPAEAKTLSALGAKTFIETFGHLYQQEDLDAFISDAHGIEKYEATLSDPTYRVWLAKDRAGKAAGYCVAGPAHLPAPDMKPRSGELVRLYVHSEFQGAGLGEKLLESTLSWLEANYDEIYLSVYAENIGAQRLYRRHGFEIIHEYFFMVGTHADPEFIMKRKVSDGLEN